MPCLKHAAQSLTSPVFLAKDEVPDYTQRRWGGVFGGPIVKDRLFFFAGYEDLLRESNDTLAIGDYWRGRGYDTVEPISTTDHPFLVKMDANLTDRHRLSVRYDRTVNTDVNTVLTSPAAITSHEARQTVGGPVWNLVGNLTSTLGSASFNEFRAYYMSLMPPMTCNASGTGGRANLELGPPGTYAWQWYPTSELPGADTAGQHLPGPAEARRGPGGL